MFEKASKKKSKLKMALYGPSGSGKTFSALSIASGLGKRIAVIDTERGSAAKYADVFSFDVCELDKTDINDYIKAIQYASTHYDVLVIDSLTHAWQTLLEEVDKLGRSKYKGNSFAAWSEGTPKQRGLVDALLRAQCHIITTMRAKTEWVSNTSERGKSTPSRVGLSPEQGKGIEYEFDFLASITPEHTLHFEKSRAIAFQDKVINKPDNELGQALLSWLEDGHEIKDGITTRQKQALLKLVYQTGYQCKRNIDTLTEAEANQFIEKLTAKLSTLSESNGVNQ